MTIRGIFIQGIGQFLCVTNRNVLLATTCPPGYISRDSIATKNSPLTNVYEYDILNNKYNPVGGQVYIFMCKIRRNSAIK